MKARKQPSKEYIGWHSYRKVGKLDKPSPQTKTEDLIRFKKTGQVLTAERSIRTKNLHLMRSSFSKIDFSMIVFLQDCRCRIKVGLKAGTGEWGQ